MSFIRQLKSILTKSNTPPVPAAGSAETDRRRQKRHIHKGRRVLIIDDSPTIVAALGKILRSAGCLITEAADAESGIDIARATRPDLIFLDIVLPGVNGFAALRQMRKEEATRRIPVIMISGNEQATEQFYAKRIGADDFMKKPFARHEVFARIEALVATGKLAQLENADSADSADSEKPVVSIPPPQPEASSDPFTAAPRLAQRTDHLPDDTVARMTPLEARRQLASMGLHYFSQEQFAAAIKRADRKPVDLFIIGGGIETTA